MPLFTVFGILSDKIGRKWIIMSGCLFAVLSYLPIYHAMHDAAGNNVETFTSSKAKATGATVLTAMTKDPTGKLVPAKEAPNPDTKKLVFLVWLQMVWVSHGLRSNCGLSCGSVSGKDQIHVTIVAVPHWQRRVWRLAAADWHLGERQYGPYLRGTVVPHGCSRIDVYRGINPVA